MNAERVAYATTNATLAHGGQRISIKVGEPWDADDPLVAAYPGMFAASLERVRSTREASGVVPVVETATRAPGETRRARRGGSPA